MQSNQEENESTSKLLREKASEADAIASLTDKREAVSRFLTLDEEVRKMRRDLLSACLSSGRGTCDLATGATIGSSLGGGNGDGFGCDGVRGKVVAPDGRCVCPADSRYKSGCGGECEDGFTGQRCNSIQEDPSSLLYKKILPGGDGVLSPSFQMDCPSSTRFLDRTHCRRGSPCEPPFFGQTCSVCKDSLRDEPQVKKTNGEETWTCARRGHFSS